jgi:hypothetical protein
MYDIIEVTVNGQKVNPNDIVVKWREWDGQEYTGSIESYAYAIAENEVGMAESGDGW